VVRVVRPANRPELGMDDRLSEVFLRLQWLENAGKRDQLGDINNAFNSIIESQLEPMAAKPPLT
jgi:hypothetical protein